MTKTHGMTASGAEITDEMVERLAAEAEAGYDLARLRRVGRPSIGASVAIGVHVRLEPDLHRDLVQAAAQARLSVSELIRETLRARLREAS